MYASAVMAFLHYLAAFTLVAALAVQVALFKPPLSAVQAQRLQRTDFIVGAAAGRSSWSHAARRLLRERTRLLLP